MSAPGSRWRATHLEQQRLLHPAMGWFVLAPPPPDFRPGQFVLLGLPEPDGALLSRAYSLASPPGAPPSFLLARVDGGQLSPRLFALRPGDPLWISAAAAGHFTLDLLVDGEDLWLIGTGTGLAPYLSMLAEGAALRRFARVLLVHGVRTAADRLPEDLLPRPDRPLARLSLLSRAEGAPLPTGCAAGRVTEALADGRLERWAGAALDPSRARVLLCGNPMMIKEMRAMLEARGFRLGSRRQPGTLGVERFG